MSRKYFWIIPAVIINKIGIALQILCSWLWSGQKTDKYYCLIMFGALLVAVSIGIVALILPTKVKTLKRLMLIICGIGIVAFCVVCFFAIFFDVSFII